MKDPRLDQLAKQLVSYSVALKKGEKVLLDLYDCPDALGVALIRAVRKAGGVPFINKHSAILSREMARGATEEQYGIMSKNALALMKKMDAYIAIRGSDNITELSDVPAAKMQTVMQKMRPVINYRVKDTKWVVLRYPSSAMAQQAGMSTEAFEDFYFDVCLLNYCKFVPAAKKLKALMDKTKEVHIVGGRGNDTDLRFSIKGLKAIPCVGERNIPDGEVFTAPVKNSVEGVIQYNTPTVYQGVAFDDVRLEFSKGKVVKATANNTRALNKILDQDPGARYVGEFALGYNPKIKEPMRDILFDEKIAGSFHFTPGQAYEGVADNGNRSQVHWDMVCIQRPDYGGGEIYFDGKLVRKNGKFLAPGLKMLNG